MLGDLVALVHLGLKALMEVGTEIPLLVSLQRDDPSIATVTAGTGQGLLQTVCAVNPET